MANMIKQLRSICLPAALVGTILLTGCGMLGGGPGGRAPVRDRFTSSQQQAPAVPGTPAQPSATVGYHTVEAGDTLMNIGRRYNQNARDLAAWNKLDYNNPIEIGQIIRVVPPQGAASSPHVPSSATAPAASAAPAASTPAPAASGDTTTDGINLAWPSAGRVIENFNGGKNKGINIGGALGDPILSAADGVVVVAGPNRGYGNLVVIKHNSTYLTAYAHNLRLLVKEDQRVRKGQKIAEMGNLDSEGNVVKLHFEVRRKSVAVDPLKYLPPQ